MKKWLKVVLILAISIVAILLILRQVYLTSDTPSKPTLGGTEHTDIVTTESSEREYLWYQPKGVKDSTSIVYVLHGSTGNGPDTRVQFAYEFDKIADQEGIVIVYPTGFDNHWNDCRGTADYQANIQNIDDITFLQSIESDIANKLNVKFKKRFVTGHSNGGHFAFKVALEAPEWVDAIAPISANLPIDKNLDCKKSGKFVPLLLMNGTDDPINPYEGGLVSIMGNDSRGTVMSTMETIKYWLSLTICSIDAKTTELPNIATSDNSNIIQHSWVCADNSKVVLYEMVNAGHTIPHKQYVALPSVLGKTNQDVTAAEVIWTFFKNHSL